METKNHPRFCAKYVKQLGVAKQQKIGWNRFLMCEGKYYIYKYSSDYKVGDKVLVAKKIPLPGQQYDLHEVALAEDYWYYEWHMKKTAKEQRTNPYEPKAKNWFGRGRYIVEQVSLEYIKKNFK